MTKLLPLLLLSFAGLTYGQTSTPQTVSVDTANVNTLNVKVLNQIDGATTTIPFSLGSAVAAPTSGQQLTDSLTGIQVVTTNSSAPVLFGESGSKRAVANVLAVTLAGTYAVKPTCLAYDEAGGSVVTVSKVLTGTKVTITFSVAGATDSVDWVCYNTTPTITSSKNRHK